MHLNPDLKFRLQFIASSKKTDDFAHWQYTEIPDENLNIYTHPELQITYTANPFENTKLIIIGFAIDPNFPDKTNEDILNDLVSRSISFKDLTQKISNLAGRFVFILCMNGYKYVIHDMCGLRTVYYSITNDHIYIASQPLLFKSFFEPIHSDNYKVYTESKHYKNYIEYWLPCGLTLYENINQLMPNHYLNIQENIQVRYWPYKKIEKQDLKEASVKAANFLNNLILSANNRFNLALPLTAGWDSRLLLAASKKYLKNLFIYTLQYRWLVEKSPDIIIPRYIAKKFNLPYNKLDCRKEMNSEFYKIFKSNVDIAHDDYAKITNGMINIFPQNLVTLIGNVSELGRNSFYSEEKQEEVSTSKDLLFDWPEWSEIPFILEYLDNWIKDVRGTCNDTGLDIIDLWYMELFMGGWLTQRILEWDIVHEQFIPYNFRPLIETMLGVPVKYRLHDKPILYENIMKQLWPELLYWPFNPPKWNRRFRFKYFIADQSKKIGLYKVGLKIYTLTYPIYLKLKGYK
jgi:hypothetical protein